MSGGARCARLLTSRNLDTIPTTAAIVDTGTMAPVEANQLLLAGLAAAGPSDAVVATRLAQLLGGWPLLLRLVNGVLHQRNVRNRQSLAAAMALVPAMLEKHGVTAFDVRHAEARDQAVDRTLAVSLDLLSAPECARYFELGVFADGEVPLAAVARLWNERGGMDFLDVEELATRLAGYRCFGVDWTGRSSSCTTCSATT